MTTLEPGWLERQTDAAHERASRLPAWLTRREATMQVAILNMIGNLTKKYEPLVLDGWDGCSHLDCLPRCKFMNGHCERLRLHLIAVGEEEPEPPDLTAAQDGKP